MALLLKNSGTTYCRANEDCFGVEIGADACGTRPAVRAFGSNTTDAVLFIAFRKFLPGLALIPPHSYTPPMTDYFPLKAGAIREYSTETSRGKGTLTIEVLSVTAGDGKTSAKCRRTTIAPGGNPAIALYEAVVDEKEVRTDSFTEFPLPVRKGAEWIRSPRRYWIETLDADVETPAGTFEGCLRVAYLIAEGDGGSGERYYAPGVGLVKVVENDEGEPFTHELTRIQG